MKRKPMTTMLGLLVLTLVASTIQVAEPLALPGDPGAERSSPGAGPASGHVWMGESPRYGVHVVVTSGAPLNLESMDALVEALLPHAGVGPTLPEEIEIGIIPDAQLQGIATGLGIPEEVLCIRQGSQILLTEQLLASSSALTHALGVHLFKALREQDGPVQEVQFGG